MVASSSERTPEAIAERLAEFLGRTFGEALDVVDLEPLAGGASRAAWGFELRPRGNLAAPSRRLVLRLDLGGKIYDVALSRREEAGVLRAAHGGGVRVPEVLAWCEDPSVLGRDFLVMERVDGETIGRRIVAREDLAAARTALPEQLGRELARIHSVDASALAFLPRAEAGASPARTVLDRARGELDRVGSPQPAIVIGLHWLEERAPSCAETVLVHGDYRLGNIVVGVDGLRAVLDWEFASIGDPHEDLAWPFVRDWRFGNDERRFAGISAGDEFIAAYEHASGRQVDRDALAWWEIAGNLRWALGCLTQARRHISGEERSVELASLGRRWAEMALEMVELIERAEGR